MSAAASPASRAAAAMREICATKTGDERHRAADELMCDLMRQMGFSECVEIFLQAVGGYHDNPLPRDADHTDRGAL
jgi:UTP:GlnB (protein PII) uridylyltransferase